MVGLGSMEVTIRSEDFIGLLTRRMKVRTGTNHIRSVS